ncbi:MAG: hypothetical protein EBR30_22385 [Cytophagia bacterium]|nr:hypothetical protein [Cytophagia bacterium]
MASFTDAIPQFNPYIQQLPVEAMVAVGMEKQQRYDQGVQRIQSQIDQVAGLDVYRPEDKQHLQSKLNEIGSKLKTVAAADFSNYQLVNSVAGMTSSIVKDPVILAALQSTQNIKNNEKTIEEARQKGELTPDNLDFYNKKLDAYQNSGLVDERGKPIVFGAKYDPYFDIFKFAKETFDAVKPDNLTYDEVFTKDANGNTVYSPIMTRLEKEGRFPQKVRETIDQIFSDPRVSKQLQITGEYNYKGYSPEMLKQRITNQENAVLAAQNSQIAELTLMKNGVKTDEEKKQIDDQIANIQNSISTVRGQYNKLRETTDVNPEIVRGYLHEDDVRNRYTTMFGYVNTKQTAMSNPGWEANYKMEQAAWDRQKFYEEMAFKKERARVEDYYKELELAQKTGVGAWELGDVSSDFDVVATFEQDFDRASENYVNSSSGFIWDAIYSKVPGNDARFQRLIDAGNTKQKAIDIILRQDAEKQGLDEVEFANIWGNKAVQEINRAGGVVPEDLLMSYNSYTSSKRGLEDLQVIKSQVDSITASQTDASILKILSGDEIKPQTIKFRGKDVDLSKQNIVDLGVYMNGNKHILGFAINDGARQAADAAKQRLEREGKGYLADYLLRNMVPGESVGDKVFSAVTKILGAPLGVSLIPGAGGYELGDVSRNIRRISQPIETAKDIWNSIVGDTDFDVSQVGKVSVGIDNDQFTNALSTKASTLRNIYNINPNVKASLFTGDPETDRNKLINVKRLAGAYAAAGQNLSSTFGDFSSLVSSVTDAKDLNLEVEAYDAGGGESQFLITGYTPDGDKVSMSIQPDEASRFGLVNPYVSNPVKILENRINARGGRTSYGNPNNEDTYINGDSYFQKTRGDFPMLINSPYNVMANITNSNGMYYGKVFVQDPATGRNAPVFTTPPADLETIYNSLRSMDSNFIRSIISNR